MRAIVDTELWSLAKKRPLRAKFGSEDEFEKAMDLHLKAISFFENEFIKIKLYMTVHQLAELFHVLAFRGYRIPLEEASAIILEIIKDPTIVKVKVSVEHVLEAMKESIETNIHIWDFLCFLPAKGLVETIYTVDKHFKTIGARHGVSIVNPIGEWLGP